MNIFIYADESGVFDVIHNDYYVFAWVICIGAEERDIYSRKFSNAERRLLSCEEYADCDELKATKLSPKHKMSLYRSMNNFHRGTVIISQKRVHNKIFASKKSKQRYLDYAFKIGVKKHIETLISSGEIPEDEEIKMYFVLDEHTTATDGKYELRESIHEEFKYGTFNYNYQCHFPPILPNLNTVEVRYVDSKKTVLVRAADIIANVTLHKTKKNKLSDIVNRQYIKNLP